MAGRHLFTADPHFGHGGILEHCQRPFASTDEMDRVMIERWNAIVTKHDTLWVVGDFAYERADPRYLRRIFGQLSGSLHLIRGNHDDANIEALGWSSVRDYAEVVADKQRLVLSHYPMRAWNAMRRGSVQLFGHCHGRMPGSTQCLDVGVDPWNYTPVSWPEIRARLATQPVVHFVDGTDEVDVLPLPDEDPDPLPPGV